MYVQHTLRVICLVTPELHLADTMVSSAKIGYVWSVYYRGKINIMCLFLGGIQQSIYEVQWFSPLSLHILGKGSLDYETYLP